jgi:hypothetical protein
VGATPREPLAAGVSVAPHRGTTGAAVEGYLVATHALTDSTDAERSGVLLELS